MNWGYKTNNQDNSGVYEAGEKKLRWAIESISGAMRSRTAKKNRKILRAAGCPTNYFPNRWYLGGLNKQSKLIKACGAHG